MSSLFHLVVADADAYYRAYSFVSSFTIAFNHMFELFFLSPARGVGVQKKQSRRLVCTDACEVPLYLPLVRRPGATSCFMPIRPPSPPSPLSSFPSSLKVWPDEPGTCVSWSTRSSWLCLLFSSLSCATSPPSSASIGAISF